MQTSTHAPASSHRPSRYSWNETLATAEPGARYRLTGLFFSLVRDRCRDLGCNEGAEITCVENREGFVTVEQSDRRRVRLEREYARFVQVEPIGSACESSPRSWAFQQDLPTEDNVEPIPLILVVDQDADSREILKAAFEARGHQVIAMADGSDVDRCERKPSAIIGEFPLDVREHLALVRGARRVWGDTPKIITYTAWADAGHLLAAQEVSDAVISKPSYPFDVVLAVEGLLLEE